MSKATKKVAIVYGFNEGPWMGRRLRKALEDAGHVIVEDYALADVIIAHSGGCFMISKLRDDQHMIMVGLPFWPGRSTLTALCKKIWTDAHTHHREGELHFWLHKTAHNLRYFWNMRRNFTMMFSRSRGEYWKLPTVTLVRYKHDPFCTPDNSQLRFATSPQIVDLPGHHDDCWRRPDPIVDIVQS